MRSWVALALIAAVTAGCDETPTRVTPVASIDGSSMQLAASDAAPKSPSDEVASDAPPEAPGESDSPPRPPVPPTAATLDRVEPKSFDDIKFDIEPDAPFFRSMLTDEIEQLDGQRIRIRGWILPTPRRKGLKTFVLVRDNQECCFGPGAALYDCILVEMVPGETATFSTKSIAVEGRFRIEVFPGPSGTPLAIYQMKGEAVTP